MLSHWQYHIVWFCDTVQVIWHGLPIFNDRHKIVPANIFFLYSMLHWFDKKHIGLVLDSFVWLEMGIVCNLIERSTEIKYHFYLIKV